MHVESLVGMPRYQQQHLENGTRLTPILRPAGLGCVPLYFSRLTPSPVMPPMPLAPPLAPLPPLQAGHMSPQTLAKLSLPSPRPPLPPDAARPDGSCTAAAPSAVQSARGLAPLSGAAARRVAPDLTGSMSPGCEEAAAD